MLAVSPAAVTLDRGNISDTLLILLLVLAADALVGAMLVTGSRWGVLLAGLWVGLAFQAKMVEAWLVIPALADHLPRRLRGDVADPAAAAGAPWWLSSPPSR